MLETIPEVFPDARYQRCIVHFYLNIFSVTLHNKMQIVAMMLVCARLRHVAGTQWGTRRYISMNHLNKFEDDLLSEYIAG